MAMRMMGEQFVTGQTIDEALRNARRLEARGFRYSYDMLGEAATTAADAARYYRDYETAIHAIGRASAGRGVYEGPGISIKLSALHPRYSRLQRARVMTELLPRLQALAYQKRATAVLDWIIDLARRSSHRLMVRLVKGAYWDSEIKRAQVDGLEGFPVFTRKIHTDVSYIACARMLLAAPDAVFPQFATHNAYTVAAVLSMAGDSFSVGQYEFQCLHGMGEPLYEEVVGHNKLNRPARIYAPVGTHETLLAYLVRRLLENGANSSFVNRIQDPAVPVSELAEDPVAKVAATHPVGAPHPRIALPRDLFGPDRINSAGLDLSNETCLASLATTLRLSAAQPWTAAPPTGGDMPNAVRNPADLEDVVGHVTEATPQDVDAALDRAAAATPAWQATPPADRAACLLRAADLLEARMQPLLGLIVREAGKSLPNAIAEVREAVDFLRFYATEATNTLTAGNHRPLGPVACISPWNFPLAIFTGQVAAALAAGNTVLAKPAEETPLIAAQAVAVLHQAGVPPNALQLLPGEGDIGAQLVADPRTRAVVFTGSTAVARLIQGSLAQRLNPDGTTVPLIAETGGQNALIVDSSALAEQVVADVLVSAFDSAGQRCSALRVLCLQDDIAERTLAMLRGALAELAVGTPERLSVDIGPVISAEARAGIEAHITAMRTAGHAVHQAPLPDGCSAGTFVPPTIIEIATLASLKHEVFGPVLHVLRFPRDALDALLSEINATGYGLTFGVHTRIDETVARVLARAQAGNIYVNRNLVGAVVGVQPFGGHGLSGTGPKAGGPLYLRRLMAEAPAATGLPPGRGPVAARLWAEWLDAAGLDVAASQVRALLASTPVGVELDLAGPVGERNQYSTEPRGAVLCIAADQADLLHQLGAVLATGNRAVIAAGMLGGLPPLPGVVAAAIHEVPDPQQPAVAAALFSGTDAELRGLNQAMACRPGPIVPVHVAKPGRAYPLEWLVQERSVSTNTTAAGGNANLMMIG
jgi:RHH-type proline utilization regulon transcriptional repressor/proline dehydrogenase/delta 1-pyrroline-5-carboxylate dehydrogenase